MLADISKLTKKEEVYYRIMIGKYGVLYLTSKPGIAKSAIALSIANKMNHNYVDIRLSLLDETDVGLYPILSDVDGIKCLDYAVPRWAIEANKRPTIIHFDELNRASLQVRNAALQILLDRRIGSDFKFNDGVLMMSSGNLGSEDGTMVEEFDSALNNRLIHINHTLPTKEWLVNFGLENCHKCIVDYISANPEELYKYSNKHSSFASPRSWTMLSEFIIKNWGIDSQYNDFIDILSEVCFSYIGPSSIKFIRWLHDNSILNIYDILNDYNSNRDKLTKYNRDKKSELLNSLKQLDISELNPTQILNCIKFLKTIDDDELVGYLMNLTDTTYDITSPNIVLLFSEFKDELTNIYNIIEENKLKIKKK